MKNLFSWEAMCEVTNLDKKRKTKVEYNTIDAYGVRTELDAEHPQDTIDRYPGDSVNEHKELEKVNEGLAEKEIKQVFHNS